MVADQMHLFTLAHISFNFASSAEQNSILSFSFPFPDSKLVSVGIRRYSYYHPDYRIIYPCHYILFLFLYLLFGESVHAFTSVYSI